MDSKAQQDNSSTQIQSPGTKTGRHHGEAIRENELRRICLCVEIGVKAIHKDYIIYYSDFPSFTIILAVFYSEIMVNKLPIQMFNVMLIVVLIVYLCFFSCK